MASQELFQVFQKTAEVFPSNTFLLGDQAWSYGHALEKIRALIDKLQVDIPEASVIGVVGEKDIETYCFFLTALGLNCTYVPMSPSLPLERMKFILRDSAIEHVLFQTKFSSVFEKLASEVEGLKGYDFSTQDVKKQIPVRTGDSYAYCLYTSGSTGQPKGVPISAENILSYLENIRQVVPCDETSRVAQVCELSFDLSVHDMWLAWSTGATLVPMTEKHQVRPLDFFRDHSISHALIVPSMVELWTRGCLSDSRPLESLRQSQFCGEGLPVETLEKWKALAPQSRILNIYGPTEATIAFTWLDCTDSVKHRSGIVNIGRPFSSQSVVIDGANGESRGELILVGSQVGSHYRNRPDLSERQFFVSEKGQRCYRTGDLVEPDEEGDLYFLGRLDQQVKINGHRVELGDVNHHLSRALDGARVVSFVLKDSGRGDVICAVVEGEESTPRLELTKRLRQSLPTYMIPKKIVYLETFPLNSRGKLDRQQIQQTVGTP